jgi:ribosomal protein S27AE
MVTRDILSQNFSSNQVVRVPMVKCPKCLNGRMAQDDDGLTCANCGKIIYRTTLPRVPKSDVY